MKKTLITISLFSILVLFSCNEEAPLEQSYNLDANTLSKSSGKNVSSILNDMNAQLEQEDANVRIAYAEWITDSKSEEVGRNIFYSNVGNKQLGAHWVSGDPNRDGRTNITWIKEQVDGEPNGVSLAGANGAINGAMNTWESAQCSEIPLSELSDGALDWGYIQALVTGGYQGTLGWTADITHAGWLPGRFFDIALGGGASNSVIGVTFTFVWYIGGTPTDMDNNGKSDVAFKEIYYNNTFPWSVDGINSIDIETVVLHEVGHGLSQGHFGKAFRTNSNGKLHFSPRAVMNAGYTGVQRDLTGTDNAGHCSIWGSW